MQDAAIRLRARGLKFQSIGPIDLEVAAGRCLAVSGPSGAGKSLTLKMLADLVPHEGDCFVDGVAAGSMSGPGWRRLVRYVSSEPGWWAASVAQHFADANGQAENMRRLSLDASLLEAAPERLSTGERQRMAFLRAIEDRPKVLLLDEPTSALDPVSVHALEEIVREMMQAGCAVVLTSHDPEQVERLAHTVMQLESRR
ncbi:ABC transporter ATP-binding protein [Aliirhizobium smilacinae]|uniref:ATP-binding cassette domain-containing protein n=1 Tax=Aliirhizobium smilacinae TaxID=1395944 RepID=A0A5C4XS66_9HYPH|nr:ATP-binding cassette domain-containing protein [Rhizobium smilacinae]TNM66188.1 ATP-binding cassette domain-containing protein [Rhizobium smilacinae]